MLEIILTSQFWVSVFEIMVVNILLSGDNAVVIALAARNLPAHQQKRAVLFGSLAAIAMRVVLTIFAASLLRFPYLKLVGSLLLLWIAVQLLLPDHDDGSSIQSSDQLWGAVKTILFADLIMSLDNVLGVAAAAKGNVPLLVIGLAVSVPLIIFGSTLILKVMDRFPVIITFGAALLGYVAGEMAVTDPALVGWVEHHAPWLHQILPWGGALLVVGVGRLLVARRPLAPSKAIEDLAVGDQPPH